MEKIGAILQKPIKRITVNSLDKSITTVNSNATVNSNPIWDEIENLIKSNDIKPEGIAQHIAENLDDTKSLRYYILLVKENNYTRLLDAMHQTREAWKEGKIKTTKPIYFIGILRRWGFQTRFKEK